jgi:hypothetical protein
VIDKKMNERQTSAMKRGAATSTEVRKKKIMDEVCIEFYPVASFVFIHSFIQYSV